MVFKPNFINFGTQHNITCIYEIIVTCILYKLYIDNIIQY